MLKFIYGAQVEINIRFDNLTESINVLPATNIINYNEVNFSDNPGRLKLLFKRETKYSEQIKNQTKSSTSVLFAGTATGKVLPLYIVFKAEDSWWNGGPKNLQYIIALMFNQESW